MCCTLLAENTGRKKSPKIRQLRTIAQLCRAVGLSAQLRHVSTIGKKFQRVSRLAFVTAATSLTRGQPNFARCLAVSWARTLGIYIFGGSWTLTDFARCKIHFMSKSCIKLYFTPCGFYLLSSFSFFPRLIAAVENWMSTILPHMMWP